MTSAGDVTQRRLLAPRFAYDDEVNAERIEATRARIDQRVKLTKLFRKHDTNGSKKLERSQVKALLTELDDFTPAGTEPSEEELEFIIKVADEECNKCISRKELEDAIDTWKIYTEKRTQLEETMKKYDKSGTGKLEMDELKAYLIDLNGGKPVDDAEVEWVMTEADFFGDGAIRQVELLLATSAWYTRVEERKSSRMCTVL